MRTEAPLVVCLALTLASRKHSENRQPLHTLFIPGEVGEASHTSLTQSSMPWAPTLFPWGGDEAGEGTLSVIVLLLVPT